ncbi:MAG: ferredoxin [Alphaproteobacteria bacterium]|nr:ferredoxin [Alphaproteobacteria bacterium]MBU1516105.1 ferredoxin [Alphaproteobacteria bacterium]MBU2092680.1 ferredoxin [Alphaproteobacteria bacterium]MBU2153795.1 ferredoxin [Alphaproteobacteria bacterium]MBU2308423.1 ferredoxin [Alphaproteobacteria bacterium]
MRIAVDLNRCQFYAQCCFLAPDTFRLETEQVLAYHPQPDDGLRETVVRAAAACPTQAILIDYRDVGP